MPLHLYKVWNCERTMRKVVSASSLLDVLAKGKEKLGIIPEVSARLVLQQDGTDIDEDEVLEHFKGDILILLRPEEDWHEATTMLPPIWVPTQHAHGESTVNQENPPTSSVHTQHAQRKSTVNQEQPSTLSILINSAKNTAGQPAPCNIPLPQFSPTTTLLLQQCNDNGVKSLLSEAALFYHSQYPCVTTTEYYQVIGQKLVKKYPFVAHDGVNPWSYITGKLSSRIRQLRIKKHKKTSDESENTKGSMPIKKFRLESDEPEGTILDTRDLSERVEEIQKEWDGNRTKAKLKLLMAETRTNRRHMIKEGMSLNNIMAKFPPFEDSFYVMDEFYAVVDRKNPANAREEISSRTVTLFNKIGALSSASKEGDIGCSKIGLLDVIERNVAIVQGKGTKSKSVLTVIKMDNIDMPTDVLAKKLHTKKETPMAIRMIMTEEHHLTFLVGDEKIISCGSADALEAVTTLLGTYYIFDLNYPAIYGQLLGFLQQQLLLQPYNFFKGTNFQKLSHKLKPRPQQVED